MTVFLLCCCHTKDPPVQCAVAVVLFPAQFLQDFHGTFGTMGLSPLFIPRAKLGPRRWRSNRLTGQKLNQ